jgi:hypothetical protein
VFYDAGLPFVFDEKLRFLHRSRVSRVDALSLKPGPTQSGNIAQPPPPVGGEMFAADKLSVFMSNYWLAVILLLLLPLAVLFYKKRELALRLLAPLLLRL